jgi:hypothetical protein
MYRCVSASIRGERRDDVASGRPCGIGLTWISFQIMMRDLHAPALLAFLIACAGSCGGGASTGGGARGAQERRAPSPLVRMSSARLTAGDHATCLRGDRGKVTCWGPLPHTLNDLLAHPETVEVKARALDGAPAASSVVIGNETCVLDQEGSAHCLDPATLTFVRAPFSKPLRMLTMDWARACAVFRDGSLACREGNAPFRPVPGMESGVVEVATAVTHTCVLRESGLVHCFGDNETGGLGNGTTVNSDVPVPVKDLDHVVQISGRRLHTCALRSDGKVLCWGLGDDGQLGDGVSRPTDGVASSPVEVHGLDEVTAISAGNAHTCALRRGHVHCWGGRKESPQEGGLASKVIAPEEVPGLDDVVEIAAGGGHQCALRSDGSVWCWGVMWWLPARGLRKGTARPVRIEGI